MTKIFNFNQMNYSDDIINRFRSKIIIPEDYINECWKWLAHKNLLGYGQFWVEYGTKIAAHRFMYELYFGTFQRDLKVRHSCDNPECCNPHHLELGTHQDNMNDKVERNRQAKGSDLKHSVLNEKQIIHILEDIKNHKYKNQTQIANDYNVSVRTINYILNGKWWTHITKNYNLDNLKHIIITVNILSNEQVLKIRELLSNGESVKQIAEEFKADKSTIYRIKNNIFYKI